MTQADDTENFKRMADTLGALRKEQRTFSESVEMFRPLFSECSKKVYGLKKRADNAGSCPLSKCGSRFRVPNWNGGGQCNTRCTDMLAGSRSTSVSLCSAFTPCLGHSTSHHPLWNHACPQEQTSQCRRRQETEVEFWLRSLPTAEFSPGF